MSIDRHRVGPALDSMAFWGYVTDEFIYVRGDIVCVCRYTPSMYASVYVAFAFWVGLGRKQNHLLCRLYYCLAQFRTVIAMGSRLQREQANSHITRLYSVELDLAGRRSP